MRLFTEFFTSYANQCFFQTCAQFSEEFRKLMYIWWSNIHSSFGSPFLLWFSLKSQTNWMLFEIWKKTRQILDLHRGLSRQIRQLFMSLKIGESNMNKHKHRFNFEKFKPAQYSFQKSTVYGFICIRRKVITRGFGCEKHAELSVYCKPSSDKLLQAFGINSA